MTLSKRQEQCSQLASVGYSNKQIAVQLNLSVETVKTHLRIAYSKLGLRGRGELWEQSPARLAVLNLIETARKFKGLEAAVAECDKYEY